MWPLKTLGRGSLIKNEVSVLKLTLSGRLVGYLTGFRDGRNQPIFDPEFRDDPNRPTLTLTTHPRFARVNRPFAENPH